jgi:hypothetical protein
LQPVAYLAKCYRHADKRMVRTELSVRFQYLIRGRKVDNIGKLGQTDKEISILGLGTIRLPTIGSDDSQIDEQKAV